MKVQVKFFASLREIVGCSELHLVLPANASRENLLEGLGSVLTVDQLEALDSPQVSIAINQQLQKGDFSLVEQDEIAFLPPITGG